MGFLCLRKDQQLQKKKDIPLSFRYYVISKTEEGADELLYQGEQLEEALHIAQQSIHEVGVYERNTVQEQSLLYYGKFDLNEVYFMEKGGIHVFLCPHVGDTCPMDEEEQEALHSQRHRTWLELKLINDQPLVPRYGEDESLKNTTFLFFEWVTEWNVERTVIPYAKLTTRERHTIHALIDVGIAAKDIFYNGSFLLIENPMLPSSCVWK